MTNLSEYVAEQHQTQRSRAIQNMSEKTVKATVCWYGTRVKAASWKVYLMRLVMAVMNVPEQAITWHREERKVL